MSLELILTLVFAVTFSVLTLILAGLDAAHH